MTVRRRATGALLAAACVFMACTPSKHGADAKTSMASERGAPRPAEDTEAVATSSARAPENPFLGAQPFLDPSHVAQLRVSATNAPAYASAIQKLEAAPTGLWLYYLADLKDLPRWLNDAEKQRTGADPVLVLLVISNLPGRSCADSEPADLPPNADGLRAYQTRFIDKISAELRAHPSLRFAIILEPFALPVLAGPYPTPRCNMATPLYEQGIAHAITKLAGDNVAIYLGAGNGPWTCWPPMRKKLAQMLWEAISTSGVERVRGFAINTAGYSALTGVDSAMRESNPCSNELDYLERLANDLAKVGIHEPAFLVDTGRSGQPRKTGAGCNAKGAGLGERPRAAPLRFVDAYVWAKPPGTSDGGSNPDSPEFETCSSANSEPGAPPGGEWFQAHFINMLKNANPPVQ